MRDMALSAFFFALMAAVAKLMGARVPPQEVILVRGVINATFTAWWLHRKGIPWRPGQTWLLVLRGALGHFALSAYFWSVARQPLATAVILQQVHPVFTVLLAGLFLGERPGRRFVPAFLLAASGVVLLTTVRWGGPVATGGAVPILVGLLGAVLSGAAYVTVRHASRTEAEETIILWFPLTSIPLAFAGTLLEGPVVPTAPEWAGLLFVAAAGQLGQVFLTRGLAHVPAGRAVLANPLTVAFGAVLGWAMFGETVTAGTVAGGAAIVLGVLLASGRERSPTEPSPRARG